MAEPLTPRQHSVLEFVTERIVKNEESPTLREIAESQGLRSRGNIHRILLELERKGYLQLRNFSLEVRKSSKADELAASDLTEEELRVFDVLVRSIGRNGHAPTLRKIQDGLGDLSLRKVQNILEALARKRRVVLAPHQAHGISLAVPESNSSYPVVVQGLPCDAADFLSTKNRNAAVLQLPLPHLSSSFVEADALSVFGVVLLDNRSLDAYSKGDTLVASRSRKAKRGDIVVAEYSGRIIARHYSQYRSTATLSSRGFGKDGKSRLSSGDTTDIRAHIDEVRILGVVFAAIARL